MKEGRKEEYQEYLRKEVTHFLKLDQKVQIIHDQLINFTVFFIIIRINIVVMISANCLVFPKPR